MKGRLWGDSQPYSTACWSLCVLQHPPAHLREHSMEAKQGNKKTTRAYKDAFHNDYKYNYIIKLPGKYIEQIILVW